MTIGNRLKELRESIKIERADLARSLHMPYTTYVNYETDQRKPNDLVLVKLADFFNVSVDYLLERTNNPGSAANNNCTTGKKKYLMDRIAKADDKKLAKFQKLMELIDDEENGHHE